MARLSDLGLLVRPLGSPTILAPSSLLNNEMALTVESLL